VPLKYKGYTSIGYLQILSETPLPPEAFHQANLIAQALSRDMIGTGIFQESKEKCKVLDISQGGISFVHPNTRTFTRSLTQNSTILFDVLFPTGLKGSFRGIIKNIRSQENDFRVGVQFYNLNLSESQILMQVLDASNVPVQEPPEAGDAMNLENTIEENPESQETSSDEETPSD